MMKKEKSNKDLLQPAMEIDQGKKRRDKKFYV